MCRLYLSQMCVSGETCWVCCTFSSSSMVSVGLLSLTRRILLNYAVFNPDMGYCQGMSDLVAPLLTEIQDESDTFWCFVGLMENTIFISSPRDEDMERQLVGSSCAGLAELLVLSIISINKHPEICTRGLKIDLICPQIHLLSAQTCLFNLSTDSCVTWIM